MKPAGGPGEFCLPLDPGALASGPIWIQIRMEDNPVASPVPRPECLGASVERFMVVRQGCKFGPFTLKDLRRLVSMGTLQVTDEVVGVYGNPLGMLSDVVDTVPFLPVTARVAPVIHPGLEPYECREEEQDGDSYYYPPFSGLHWTAVAAAVCGILAVVLSLPRLSLFVPACVLLAVGFLLAVRSCVVNTHAGGLLVPVLSLWMVFLFHADRVDWVPFVTKPGPVARAESPSGTPFRPFFFRETPPQAESAQAAKPAEAAIPEASLVWVEYKAGP